MNNLQTKIDLFLSGTPEIPRDIIFTASQMFNEKLSRFNYKKLPSKSGLPSLSQIGKPMCQLQASKLGWKEEDKPINFKMMMTYGDMTEVLTVAVLLAAGIEITDMNKKVKLPTKVGDLYGELDLVLQLKLNDYHQVGEKSVWDIKSASSWSFDKRFASYDELKKQDDFGYCCQLFGYAKAEGVKAGGWIVVNKGTGEIKVIEADPGDQEHYINLIEQNKINPKEGITLNDYAMIMKSIQGGTSGPLFAAAHVSHTVDGPIKSSTHTYEHLIPRDVVQMYLQL